MKLTTITNISVDGVMQGLGGPGEDRRAGFERGGWALPLFDQETEALLGDVYGRADAFLFDRRTFEIFAASWGTGEWGTAEGDNPISTALNTRPKHVVSSTLGPQSWDQTSVVSGDVEAAVRALKAEGTGELQVHGSGVLVRWLLERGLVDEMILLTYPVVVGEGVRLFAASGPDAALGLLDHRASAGGVVVQTYRPAGRPQYAAE